jgi:TP901 family phage tail tape measure protein
MPTVRELLTKVLFRVDNTSYTRAEKTIQKLKKSLETVGDSAKKGQAQTTATFTNIANAGRQAGNTIQKSMEAARVSIENVRGASIRASSALNTARAAGGKPIITRAGAPKAAKGGKTADYLGAGAAAAVAGAAITAPLANAVDDAAEFEYQMSKVQAVTQADAETMKKLTAQARALGRATEFNAKQAAEAQYYLGLAGWKQEAILAATPGLLRLAIAGGTDLARTADIISDDMTAMGIAIDDSGKSVRHFGDVFAATMSNSNTTIEMMGESMKYAGTIAGTLGYSMEDVALAIGLMANNGTKAEQAGTALRAIMTRLAAPPKEAAAAFAQIAHDTGITISPVDKLTGKVKPLREVFTQLRDALKGYDEVQRVAFGKAIAGMYGTAGFNAIVKSTDADFNKLMNAIDNADGASERMAATMQNNLRGSLIATKSAAYDLNVELGKSMTPALRDVNGLLTNVLNGVTGLANEYPHLTSAMSIFAGIVGVGLVALGALGIAIGGIVTLAGAFGVTVGAPVVAAVLAIIGVIAAVIANLDTLKKKFPGLKDAASTALGTIKGMLDFLINPLETICDLLSRAKTGFDNLIAGAEQSARQRYATYTANYSNTFNLDSGDQIAPAVQASNGVSPW